MKIDRALIIRRLKVQDSLDYAKMCADSCEKFGIPYEYIDGIEFVSSEEAMELVGAWINPKQYEQARGRGVSTGNNCCHASHIKAWRRILEINKPCLILEHDSIVKGDVRTVDMIDDAIINCGHRISHPDMYEPIRQADSLVKIRTASGGHAYALTPKTAKYLIDDVEQNGVNINVDEWINLKCGLPLYAMEPSQVVCWPRVSSREWQDLEKERKEMGASWCFGDELTPSWREGMKIKS